MSSLVSAILSRAARGAVAPSTVRGLRTKGVVEDARRALREVDIRPLATANTKRFALALDTATERVRKGLPRGAQHWGVARKVLNIFLRDVLYTRYLCDEFSMQRAEWLLEVPLDSITAKHIKQSAGRGRLPAWPGVKNVTPELSRRFQKAAAVEAADRGFARVHLDALWWSASRDEDAP